MSDMDTKVLLRKFDNEFPDPGARPEDAHRSQFLNRLRLVMCIKCGALDSAWNELIKYQMAMQQQMFRHAGEENFLPAPIIFQTYDPVGGNPPGKTSTTTDFGKRVMGNVSGFPAFFGFPSNSVQGSAALQRSKDPGLKAKYDFYRYGTRYENENRLPFDNTVVLLDEAHNLFGQAVLEKKPAAQRILQRIRHGRGTRAFFFSATPIEADTVGDFQRVAAEVRKTLSWGHDTADPSSYFFTYNPTPAQEVVGDAVRRVWEQSVWTYTFPLVFTSGNMLATIKRVPLQDMVPWDKIALTTAALKAAEKAAEKAAAKAKKAARKAAAKAEKVARMASRIRGGDSRDAEADSDMSRSTSSRGGDGDDDRDKDFVLDANDVEPEYEPDLSEGNGENDGDNTMEELEQALDVQELVLDNFKFSSSAADPWKLLPSQSLLVKVLRHSAYWQYLLQAGILQIQYPAHVRRTFATTPDVCKKLIKDAQDETPECLEYMRRVVHEQLVPYGVAAVRNPRVDIIEGWASVRALVNSAPKILSLLVELFTHPEQKTLVVCRNRCHERAGTVQHVDLKGGAKKSTVCNTCAAVFYACDGGFQRVIIKSIKKELARLGVAGGVKQRKDVARLARDPVGRFLKEITDSTSLRPFSFASYFVPGKDDAIYHQTQTNPQFILRRLVELFVQHAWAGMEGIDIGPDMGPDSDADDKVPPSLLDAVVRADDEVEDHSGGGGAPRIVMKTRPDPDDPSDPTKNRRVVPLNIAIDVIVQEATKRGVGRLDFIEKMRLNSSISRQLKAGGAAHTATQRRQTRRRHRRKQKWWWEKAINPAIDRDLLVQSLGSASLAPGQLRAGYIVLPPVRRLIEGYLNEQVETNTNPLRVYLAVRPSTAVQRFIETYTQDTIVTVWKEWALGQAKCIGFVWDAHATLDKFLLALTDHTAKQSAAAPPLAFEAAASQNLLPEYNDGAVSLLDRSRESSARSSNASVYKLLFGSETPNVAGQRSRSDDVVETIPLPGDDRAKDPLTISTTMLHEPPQPVIQELTQASQPAKLPQPPQKKSAARPSTLQQVRDAPDVVETNSELGMVRAVAHFETWKQAGKTGNITADKANAFLKPAADQNNADQFIATVMGFVNTAKDVITNLSMKDLLLTTTGKVKKFNVINRKMNGAVEKTSDSTTKLDARVTAARNAGWFALKLLHRAHNENEKKREANERKAAKAAEKAEASQQKAADKVVATQEKNAAKAAAENARAQELANLTLDKECGACVKVFDHALAQGLKSRTKHRKQRFRVPFVLLGWVAAFSNQPAVKTIHVDQLAQDQQVRDAIMAAEPAPEDVSKPVVGGEDLPVPPKAKNKPVAQPLDTTRDPSVETPEDYAAYVDTMVNLRRKSAMSPLALKHQTKKAFRCFQLWAKVQADAWHERDMDMLSNAMRNWAVRRDSAPPLTSGASASFAKRNALLTLLQDESAVQSKTLKKDFRSMCIAFAEAYLEQERNAQDAEKKQKQAVDATKRGFSAQNDADLPHVVALKAAVRKQLDDAVPENPSILSTKPALKAVRDKLVVISDVSKLLETMEQASKLWDAFRTEWEKFAQHHNPTQDYVTKAGRYALLHAAADRLRVPGAGEARVTAAQKAFLEQFATSQLTSDVVKKAIMTWQELSMLLKSDAAVRAAGSMMQDWLDAAPLLASFDVPPDALQQYDDWLSARRQDDGALTKFETFAHVHRTGDDAAFKTKFEKAVKVEKAHNAAALALVNALKDTQSKLENLLDGEMDKLKGAKPGKSPNLSSAAARARARTIVKRQAEYEEKLRELVKYVHQEKMFDAMTAVRQELAANRPIRLRASRRFAERASRMVRSDAAKKAAEYVIKRNFGTVEEQMDVEKQKVPKVHADLLEDSIRMDTMLRNAAVVSLDDFKRMAVKVRMLFAYMHSLNRVALKIVGQGRRVAQTGWSGDASDGDDSDPVLERDDVDDDGVAVDPLKHLVVGDKPSEWRQRSKQRELMARIRYSIEYLLEQSWVADKWETDAFRFNPEQQKGGSLVKAQEKMLAAVVDNFRVDSERRHLKTLLKTFYVRLVGYVTDFMTGTPEEEKVRKNKIKSMFNAFHSDQARALDPSDREAHRPVDAQDQEYAAFAEKMAKVTCDTLQGGADPPPKAPPVRIPHRLSRSGGDDSAPLWTDNDLFPEQAYVPGEFSGASYRGAPQVPRVMVLTENQMEGISFFGVRKLIFWSMSRTSTEFDQAQGRCMRACTSHVAPFAGREDFKAETLAQIMEAKRANANVEIMIFESVLEHGDVVVPGSSTTAKFGMGLTATASQKRGVMLKKIGEMLDKRCTDVNLRSLTCLDQDRRVDDPAPGSALSTTSEAPPTNFPRSLPRFTVDQVYRDRVEREREKLLACTFHEITSKSVDYDPGAQASWYANPACGRPHDLGVAPVRVGVAVDSASAPDTEAVWDLDQLKSKIGSAAVDAQRAAFADIETVHRPTLLAWATLRSNYGTLVQRLLAAPNTRPVLDRLRDPRNKHELVMEAASADPSDAESLDAAKLAFRQSFSAAMATLEDLHRLALAVKYKFELEPETEATPPIFIDAVAQKVDNRPPNAKVTNFISSDDLAALLSIVSGLHYDPDDIAQLVPVSSEPSQGLQAVFDETQKVLDRDDSKLGEASREQPVVVSKETAQRLQDNASNIGLQPAVPEPPLLTNIDVVNAALKRAHHTTHVLPPLDAVVAAATELRDLQKEASESAIYQNHDFRLRAGTRAILHNPGTAFSAPMRGREIALGADRHRTVPGLQEVDNDTIESLVKEWDAVKTKVSNQNKNQNDADMNRAVMRRLLSKGQGAPFFDTTAQRKESERKVMEFGDRLKLFNVPKSVFTGRNYDWTFPLWPLASESGWDDDGVVDLLSHKVAVDGEPEDLRSEQGKYVLMKFAQHFFRGEADDASGEAVSLGRIPNALEMTLDKPRDVKKVELQTALKKEIPVFFFNNQKLAAEFQTKLENFGTMTDTERDEFKKKMLQAVGVRRKGLFKEQINRQFVWRNVYAERVKMGTRGQDNFNKLVAFANGRPEDGDPQINTQSRAFKAWEKMNSSQEEEDRAEQEGGVMNALHIEFEKAKRAQAAAAEAAEKAAQKQQKAAKAKKQRAARDYTKRYNQLTRRVDESTQWLKDHGKEKDISKLADLMRDAWENDFGDVESDAYVPVKKFLRKVGNWRRNERKKREQAASSSDSKPKVTTEDLTITGGRQQSDTASLSSAAAMRRAMAQMSRIRREARQKR
jgi:hypothetical protein